MNLLSTATVAQRLNCSQRWVRLLCERGQLRHLRFGVKIIRIREADLAEFVAASAR